MRDGGRSQLTSATGIDELIIIGATKERSIVFGIFILRGAVSSDEGTIVCVSDFRFGKCALSQERCALVFTRFERQLTFYPEEMGKTCAADDPYMSIAKSVYRSLFEYF